MLAMFKEPVIVLHVTFGDEQWEAPYSSLEECLNDEAFLENLDKPGNSCLVWSGTLKLSGRPIQSGRELRELLVSNSRTILHKVL